LSPNHLKDEKSLYLRQHASNPVDWYPWGAEAFEKASREDKPIFLSIGYSACHWCHVMARESFQDVSVAEVLNRDYVCIKVDREERPDIDSIYMTACQMMTGRGGWPLSIVMTPDRRPFFSASYIPRHSMPGTLGIIDVMGQLADAWKLDRPTVLQTAEAVYQALVQFADRLDPQKLNGNEVVLTYQSLLRSFDEQRTGFDGPTKFPSPHRLMFLIDYYSRTNEKKALDMALRTLNRMRKSGLYDHVGFGFFRYSTDRNWHLPHFEKTLYDQAMMAMAYIQAFKVTGESDMKETAEKVLAYTERCLMSPQGLFYSAESADSEGKEGKFYLWTLEELALVLDPQEFEAMKMAFDLRPEGNFRDEATQEPSGSNLLDLVGPITSSLNAAGSNEMEATRLIKSSLNKLFDVREKRVHPDKDDKVLTDWTGLIVAAFAQASQAFKEPRYLATAMKAANCIWLKMQRNGRLYHRSVGGAVAIDGFLDDYSHFIWGLLEVYRASGDRRQLERAVELTETVLAHFSDYKGGFFQTGDSSEEMIVRLKEVYDGAIPSGNSVMAMNLVSLGTLTGERRYVESAEKVFEIFATDFSENPSAYAHLLSALAMSRSERRLLAIVGKKNEDETSKFIAAAERLYDPDLEIIHYDEVQMLPEVLRKGIDLKTTGFGPMAFICSDQVCGEPILSVKEMEQALAKPFER
jgi:uncharacterized protein YyaL (SSP411 family)